jgi:hypothetical protein
LIGINKKVNFISSAKILSNLNLRNMKKIDFEKMEKIGGGKVWKEPQTISILKKDQRPETNSHINAMQGKVSVKSNH